MLNEQSIFLQLSILMFDYVVLPVIQYLAQWMYGEMLSMSNCMLYCTIITIYHP